MDKVKEFYDTAPQAEWERLDRHPVEFELTKRMISRYVKPGEIVLDVGGGPGRYTMWLAQLGCDVTLADLSSGNVEFAKRKAAELGLTVNAISCDARELDAHIKGTEKFDHVLVMGPLYHLLEETDRVRVIEAALNLLKPDGYLYVSFIQLISPLLDKLMKYPEAVMNESFQENAHIKKVIANESYQYDGNDGFTAAYFIRTGEIAEFMARFRLEQKHIFTQEGILNPFTQKLYEQPEPVRAKWLDLAEALCERPELLGYSEHAMYIGQKL